MKLIPLFTLCLLLTGCGSLKWIPDEEPKKESTAVQILERNKEELTTIKNKTADDIELGAKARKLSGKKMTDAELGAEVRKLSSKQAATTETTSSTPKKNLKSTSDGPLTAVQKDELMLEMKFLCNTNTRLNTMIILLTLLNGAELVFLIIQAFKNARKNEGKDPKPACRLNHKTPDV